jgi:hypothetical protein
MVAATIIEAPSSTKNVNGERDPERHLTKQGHGRKRSEPSGRAAAALASIGSVSLIASTVPRLVAITVSSPAPQI